jgi:hypothetical protein
VVLTSQVTPPPDTPPILGDEVIGPVEQFLQRLFTFLFGGSSTGTGGGNLVDMPGYLRLSLTANDDMVARAADHFARSQPPATQRREVRT